MVRWVESQTPFLMERHHWLKRLMLFLPMLLLLPLLYIAASWVFWVYATPYYLMDPVGNSYVLTPTPMVNIILLMLHLAGWSIMLLLIVSIVIVTKPLSVMSDEDCSTLRSVRGLSLFWWGMVLAMHLALVYSLVFPLLGELNTGALIVGASLALFPLLLGVPLLVQISCFWSVVGKHLSRRPPTVSRVMIWGGGIVVVVALGAGMLGLSLSHSMIEMMVFFVLFLTLGSFLLMLLWMIYECLWVCRQAWMDSKASLREIEQQAILEDELREKGVLRD